MTEASTAAPAAETEADFGAPPVGIARRWIAEIEAFDRERKQYAERAERIVARYKNEHASETRRFALLWANVEVLKPTVYSRDPAPRVFRRFRDRDSVGRVASRLLERSLSCQIEKGGDYGQAARAGVLDYLLIGQGVGWVFFEPGEYGERAVLSHVHWRDFGFTAAARTWAEVTAVWRVAYMAREQLVERFGDAGEGVPLDRKPAETTRARDEEVIGKATVYEIWDSASRQTVWLHKGVAEPLDVRPYPLKLRGKFPCPRPMFGTLTTGSTVPIPDFMYYQDQALELDDLTERIASLSKALKLVGFIPGDIQPDLQKGLDSGQEVALVPVEAWAVGQGRPMDNAISWLPVADVAATLARLMELREAIKRDAYEVTGLSDIMRGSTQASETLGAQQLKAQWGSIRVRERQAEVARFCREALEIMADVICGHFEPQTIAAEANAEALPEQDMQYVLPALALLKGEGALRSYRVDVETDSTIAADEQAEREAATGLLTGVSGFLAQSMPLVQGVAMQAPHAVQPITEMVGGLLTMAVRRFRGGEEAEELIEKAMQALAQPAQQQAGPAGPSPEEMAMQAEAAKAQAAQQAAAMDAQAKMQIEVGKAEVAMRVKQMDIEAGDRREAARIAAEDRRLAANLAFEREKIELEASMRYAESERAAGLERDRAANELAKAELSKPDPGPRMDRLAETVEALAQTVASVARRLDNVAEDLAAPTEIVRGPDGRPAGVRRGKRTMTIKRGPDGRAMEIS